MYITEEGVRALERAAGMLDTLAITLEGPSGMVVATAIEIIDNVIHEEKG